jgi:hypothetical protein
MLLVDAAAGAAGASGADICEVMHESGNELPALDCRIHPDVGQVAADAIGNTILCGPAFCRESVRIKCRSAYLVNDWKDVSSERNLSLVLSE